MNKSENVLKPTKKPEAPKPTEKTDVEKPNRNLLFLGLISIGIAIATTALSLLFYHNSGDIYLDRSRPGFLPDDDEVEQQESQKKDYTFSSNGPIDPDILREYLDNYKEQLDNLDKLEKPFSSTPLSDASLGIPEK